MKIIKLEQNSEAWLHHRMGKIGGSDAKGIMPLKRGTDRTPVGYWQLLAQKVSIAPDGEKVMDRGHRLENEALELFAKEYKLDVDFEPGFWESDLDSDISVSPDACEKSNKPKWACEVKCLNSADHLKYIIKDQRAKKLNDYTAFSQLPADYTFQVVQYFLVNENLQKLYFVMYDDRIAIDKYVMHVIEINRDDILGEIELQKDVQINTLKEVNILAKELAKGKI